MRFTVSSCASLDNSVLHCCVNYFWVLNFVYGTAPTFLNNLDLDTLILSKKDYNTTLSDVAEGGVSWRTG